jgi:hypothetical protein
MASCQVFNPSLEAARRLLGDYDVSNYLLLTEDKGSLIDPFAILDTLQEAYPERRDFYEAKRYDLKKFKVRNFKGNLKSYQKFEGQQKQFRDSLYDFIRALRIDIIEEGSQEWTGLAEQMNSAGRWDKGELGPPVAAFDMLQKLLAIPKNLSDRGLAKQTANIAYSFLGRKSKISKDLWFNIKLWNKYDELYDKYDALSKTKSIQNADLDVIEETVDEFSESKDAPKNAWAHKQVIIEFITDGLLAYRPDQREKIDFENPDIDKSFFEKKGFKSPYAVTVLKTALAAIYNFVHKAIHGKPFTKYNAEKLNDLLFDLVDDIYEKDFKKWMRGIEVRDGMLYDKKGNLLEQKNYYTTLSADPFAADVLQKLFNSLDPEGKAYKLSGSQVLRRYGATYRSFSEDLHDIDGVITLEHFMKEANAQEFLDWIQTKGLSYMQRKSSVGSALGRNKFNKEIIPFLEGQSWYKNLKEVFPSWTFQTAFIGRDHKKGESVTITGYIEHPTAFEIDEETGETRPKRYVLDFFLRTAQGNYPEIFDNYWKDWKQIFEAKINMGRGKDIMDLIYFAPFKKDIYKFNAPGFRYFSFIDDIIQETEETNDDIKAVYQGYDTLDNREINYFTVDKAEAKNYGKNVRQVNVDTKGFLEGDSKEYRPLRSEFAKQTGTDFNILDNSPEGLAIQNNFFNFLKDRGYKGLDYTMFSDSQYLVAFSNDAVTDITSETPQYNKNIYDLTPAQFKKHLMKLNGDTNIYNKKYLSQGGYTNAVNEVNAYNRLNGNLRYLDVVKEENDLRNGPQKYYIKVFKTPLPIQPNSPNSQESGIDRAWFIREIEAIDDLLGLTRSEEDAAIDDLLTDTLTQEQAEHVQAMQVVKNLAASMNMTNVFGEPEVEFISVNDAIELTKNTKAPYNNEPAFVYNGKVYVVDGALSTKTLFHEFAHPFVKYLAKENPELFQKLAKKAWSELGKLGLQENFLKQYPELEGDPQGFSEEIIVHVLTMAGQAQLSNTPMPNSFSEMVSNILYQIKKFFRKLFGAGPKLSDLGVNTSFMDLANEMLSEKFNIDTSIATKESIEDNRVQYAKEINDFIKELDNAVDDETAKKTHAQLKKNIDAMYKLFSDQLRATTKDEYQELALLLTNDDSRDLAYITSTLSSYESNRVRHIKDLVEENRKLAIAFVNSLQQTYMIADKITNRIEEIKKLGVTPDSIYRVKNLTDYLDSYIDLATKVIKDLEDLGITEKSELYSLVSDIRNASERGKRSALYIYGENLTDTLWEFVEPTAKKIDERWLKRKAFLENSPLATRRLLAVEEAAYNSIKLTKETFEKMVMGDIVNNGFASQMNSLFESYLVNQDPVIGAFAKYLRTNYMEMESKIHMHKVMFSSQVIPALKKAGINARNLISKADTFLMEDSIAEKHPDGNLYEFKVLKFLDEFVGYEWWDAQETFRLEKARLKYYSTLNDDDKKEYNNIRQEYNKMRRLYFNNKYKPEYYERQELFERDDIGAEAKRRLDIVNEKLQMWKDMKRQGFEIKDETEVRKLALREKRFLYSLVDEFGNLKEGEDKLIAERLREYRDLSSSFYESKPRPGVFLKALADYEQQLLLRPSIGGDRTSEEFLNEREAWLAKNTRKVPKKEYYEIQAALYESIKQLEAKKDPKIAEATAKVIKDELAKRNVSQDIIDQIESVGDLYAIINDIASINRDESGVVAASEITEEGMELIKSLQEVIAYTKENSGKINNLTEEENDFLLDYVERFALANVGIGQMPSQDEQDRAAELFEKQSYNGLTKDENKALATAYKTLRSISDKEPTAYYLDIYNNYISLIDKQFMIDDIGVNHIDETNADSYFLLDDVVDEIKSQNAQFAIWFDKNHIRVKKYDGKGGWSDAWQRVQVWSYNVPSDNRLFESTEIPNATHETDEKGNIIKETLFAAPNLEYYTFDVKPEFLTEEILPNTYDADGNVIPPNKDNKGNWLPKRLTQGAPDGRFINSRYAELRRTDKAMFDALEKYKEFYVGIQEGKDRSTKMYLELPRYTTDIAEDIGDALRNTKKSVFGKSNLKKPKVFSRWYDDVVRFFKPQAGSFEEGDTNFEESYEVEALSFFAKQNSKIPIEGRSNIEFNNVSRNFVKSTMRYMASLEKHQKLVELSPMAKAMREFYYEKDSKTGERIYVKNKLDSAGEIVTSEQQKRKGRVDKTIGWFKDTPRYASLDYLVAREFEGQKYGKGAGAVGLNNFFGGLFKIASFGYFSLDPSSALVNYYDALMELKIEGWAFKYTNPVSLQAGKLFGVHAMSTVTAEIYKTGPKSLVGQLIEIFDPGQDYQKRALDDGLSRNLAGDVVRLNFLTNTRKWFEMLATMQTMGALMHYKKVPRTIGTKTKYINYLDAWEIGPDKVIKLKDGIDPKYGINGSEFLKMKSRMQTVTSNINGAFGEFDQPRAAQWALYRIVSFIQKHLTRMLINHYGIKGNLFKGEGSGRYDWGNDDIHMGFFSAVTNYITKSVRTYGSGLVSPSREEGVYIMKTVRWITMLMAIGYMKSVWLGYNPDDDEEEALEEQARKKRKEDLKAKLRLATTGDERAMISYLKKRKEQREKEEKGIVELPTPDTWKKLYRRSGPLPILGAEVEADLYGGNEKETARFNSQEWLKLQALYITTRVGHDQEDWLAMSGYGLGNLMSIFNLKTGAALNPTLNRSVELINYIAADINDDRAGIYQQDSGPYPWEKAGDPKWYATLAGFFGLSGQFINPAGRQKQMETERKKLTVRD